MCLQFTLRFHRHFNDSVFQKGNRYSVTKQQASNRQLPRNGLLLHEWPRPHYGDRLIVWTAMYAADILLPVLCHQVLYVIDSSRRCKSWFRYRFEGFSGFQYRIRVGLNHLYSNITTNQFPKLLEAAIFDSWIFSIFFTIVLHSFGNRIRLKMVRWWYDARDYQDDEI